MTQRTAEAIGRMVDDLQLDCSAALFRSGGRPTMVPGYCDQLDALAELIHPDSRPVLRPGAAVRPLPWVVTCHTCGRLGIEEGKYVACDYCAEDYHLTARQASVV